MRFGRLLTLIALLGIAGLSVWLLEAVRSERRPPARAENLTPDYSLENFTATAMDEQGRLRDRLRAQVMVHFPHDDSAELTEPRLELYRETLPPWRIAAQKAWVYERGELILLAGEVLIERAASPGNAALKISTSAMRVRPAAKYAETDRPVTILRDGMRVDAVGMQAYLQEGRVQLMSKVRGRYVPKTP